MMSLKQRTSLCILLSLLLTAAACGTDAGDQTNEPDSTSTQETTAPSVETLKSEYIAPDVDYGGKTITIASYDYEGNWVILNYNIALDEENGDIINDAIVERNRTVEEELNINFDLIPLDVNDRGSSSKLQKFILSGEDAFTFALPMNAGIAPMLTTSGMLYDLNSIPTLDLTHSWWNQNANEEYTIYGKQLAAVGDISLYNLGAPIVTYFNKQIIDDNKMEDPYELVTSGKWTVDKMLAMAVEGARDLDGNQKMEMTDQFGFACEQDTLQYFVVSSGVRLSQHSNDGDIKITVNNEKTIALCEKLITLFHDANTTLYANKISGYNNVFSDFFLPKMMNNELLFFSNQLLVSLNLRSMDSDFGILPTPKYDANQAEYISFANTWFSDHVIVPTTNSDLEMTGYILEAMGYYAQQTIVPAFIDNTVMNKSVRDENSAAMVELVRSSQVFDVAFIFNWGNVRSNFSSMAAANNTNFASSWASIENGVNSALKQTLDELKG